MSENKKVGQSKLLNLKQWLSVPEAARHLSTLFEEAVSEADVLRLALDGHLELSVNFVNEGHGRYGKVVDYGNIKMIPLDINSEEDVEDSNDQSPIDEDLSDYDVDEKLLWKNIVFSGERGFLGFNEKVELLEGVYDLPMIGNERLVVENRYQQLTGGPEVVLAFNDRYWTPTVGTFVAWGRDTICWVYAKSELKSEYTSSSTGQRVKTWSYVPAATLPTDSVLVVRTKALMDFHNKLVASYETKNKPLDSRTERTYLNIIGALLEITTGSFKGESFKSETQLRDFIAEKFDDLRGLSTRNTANIFATAKKALNDDLD